MSIKIDADMSTATASKLAAGLALLFAQPGMQESFCARLVTHLQTEPVTGNQGRLIQQVTLELMDEHLDVLDQVSKHKTQAHAQV